MFFSWNLAEPDLQLDRSQCDQGISAMQITKSEHRILAGLLQGQSVRTLAQTTGLPPDEVKRRIVSILQRLADRPESHQRTAQQLKNTG